MIICFVNVDLLCVCGGDVDHVFYLKNYIVFHGISSDSY